MVAIVRFRPEAESDVRTGFAWYERHRVGLGREFVLEVDAAVGRIREAPQHYAKLHRDLRRTLVHRFPYAVFFVVRGDAVTIVAVLHQATDPARWRQRRP